MFFGMEIQLKNKQKQWHKRIDSLHLTYDQVEIENYELGLWQRHWTHQNETVPVLLNHKFQMQVKFSRKEEVNNLTTFD